MSDAGSMQVGVIHVVHFNSNFPYCLRKMACEISFIYKNSMYHLKRYLILLSFFLFVWPWLRGKYCLARTFNIYNHQSSDVHSLKWLALVKTYLM